MDSRFHAVVIFLVLSPTVLPAQGVVALETVQPGARVRLTTGCVADAAQPGRRPSPNRRDRSERCVQYTGRLSRLAPDSLLVAMDGEERSLAVADIRSMRVQTGRRGNWGMGAGIGAGVGFLAGLASAGATDCSDEFLQDLCQASQMAAPVMAGALGAGVGALIGGLIRSDRWEPVSFRTDVVALRGRRAAVGLAIRF